MLNERVGNNIRVHRTEAGLTQEELAYRAKMNAPHLGTLERGCGNPKISTICSIARALGLLGNLYTVTYEYESSSDGKTSNRLSRMVNGGTALSYTYDAVGNITTIVENGIEQVRYEYDSLNQLVREDSAVQNKSIEYVYDGGGNLLARKEYAYTTGELGGVLNTVTGSLAFTVGQINPFRYRGYYYDTETGLYLAGTRYYDPVVGRWISGDSEMSGVGVELLGYNLFAYCFNNPINMNDPSGHWPKWLTGAINVVGGVLQAVAGAALVAAAPVSGGLSADHSGGGRTDYQ